MSLSMYLPLFIVVASNTIYQICAKMVPVKINTFASLSVTYSVAAFASLLIFFLTQKNASLLAEYKQLNWANFLLGISVVGLEFGFILMYKVGWEVSTASIVQSAFLAIVLLFVGFFVFSEHISFTRVLGVAVCLTGLYLINKK